MRVTSLLDEGLFDREDGRRPSDPVRPFPPIAFLCAVIVWVGAAGMFYVSYDPQRSVPDGIVAGRYVFELLEDAHEGMYGMSAPARVSIEGRSYNVRVLYEGARYRAYERFEGLCDVFFFFRRASLAVCFGGPGCAGVGERGAVLRGAWPVRPYSRASCVGLGHAWVCANERIGSCAGVGHRR